MNDFRRFASTGALFLICAGAPAAAMPQVPLGTDRDACARGDGPAFLVRIAGLKDRAGRMKVELYPATEADFLRPDADLLKEGKTFRRVWADVPAQGPVAMCIRAPAPGSYALIFTHQRKGIRKFDIWVDGVGVPGSTKIGRSKPRMEEARVAAGRGITTSEINVQYLRGLGGFATAREN
ncbi:DUF2141 domain-containing protein [Sphingomonas mucosissima]|uniref:DUF2141 domain-containing protein n=1 Tax=Sphingomonas mucosissima TaxID=370959 RepID=A0A245ZFF0_9SPHN|nr:DUF2141 domain-containing protein [Sphingomonas mucosissima]OWK28477.1 hypothetical protein SPMU_27370 [Sphingomonas mucosissima]